MTVREVLPRDAIPSIDDPQFGRGYFGDSDDEVVVLSGGEGAPRAYPLRVLGGHEIVNDFVDGRPVAVTFCPICWSTAVYDRRVGGRTLEFGVSGKLVDDALVMYDRETGSEWRQPTGECIAGEFEGTRLGTVEAPVTTYAAFTDAYPNGTILRPERGAPDATDDSLRAAYDTSGYERYRRGEDFGLYGMRGEGEVRSWNGDDLDAKTVVLGVEVGTDVRAYPLPTVEAAGGLVADTVGGESVLVVVAGETAHAFRHPGFEVRLRDGTLRGDGTAWDPTTGESVDGRRLERVRSTRLFAFAWQDAHGPDAFYEA